MIDNNKAHKRPITNLHFLVLPLLYFKAIGTVINGVKKWQTTKSLQLYP